MLVHSLALSCFSNAPPTKKSFHQVSYHGSLDDFSFFHASDTDIFLSDDGFGEPNGQWVFEDVLLHEMQAFLLDFGCCKYHLCRSLKLVRNPPADV